MSQDKYKHISDQELLNRFYTDHDNQWLGILLQRYTLLLLGVSMKYLKNEEAAKDAVQQIFLKAITELGKYRVVYVKSWLYMVARNHCLMQLRDRNTYVPVDEELASEWNNKDEILDREQSLVMLESVLDELNEAQKTCVILFYLHKKSYQEIVDHTGYNLSQVKSHIQNGKRNLKILLEKKMDQTS